MKATLKKQRISNHCNHNRYILNPFTLPIRLLLIVRIPTWHGSTRFYCWPWSQNDRPDAANTKRHPEGQPQCIEFNHVLSLIFYPHFDSTIWFHSKPKQPMSKWHIYDTEGALQRRRIQKNEGMEDTKLQTVVVSQYNSRTGIIIGKIYIEVSQNDSSNAMLQRRISTRKKRSSS